MRATLKENRSTLRDERKGLTTADTEKHRLSFKAVFLCLSVELSNLFQLRREESNPLDLFQRQAACQIS
jgi:hypothetical protein